MSEPRSPREWAAALERAIEDALVVFTKIDEEPSRRPFREGGWCARETLGHLIDSACTNQRRFVVGQGAGVERFDGYEQDAWVACQHYKDEPWQAIVTLWTAYNRHLAHVMRHTSDGAAACTALSPDHSRTVTIRYLMEDYVPPAAPRRTDPGVQRAPLTRAFSERG